MDIFPKKSDGQQAPEKVLNITNHQENANQNYNEISPYTCQNALSKRQETIIQKRPLTKWEKIFAINASHLGLISEIYKELIQLNIKKKKKPT